MKRVERLALVAVYERLNAISGMVPTNPCDIKRLGRLSNECALWIPRCMNALSCISNHEPETAIEFMEQVTA